MPLGAQSVPSEPSGLTILSAPAGQDERTVRRLRYGVGAIGVLLPVVLPLGNWIFTRFGHQTEILPASMSSSYYTGTRNIFVGALCALGVFLIGYRFNARDDRWSTTAGLFAIGVALCPTAPRSPTANQSTVGLVHIGFALALLVGLAMFCISSFRDPADPQRRTANHLYLACGVLILVFVAVAMLAAVTHWGDGWRLTPLYVCEALSVWAFGGAWIAAARTMRTGIGARNRSRTAGLLSAIRALPRFHWNRPGSPGPHRGRPA
jgi:hypothetical protein